MDLSKMFAYCANCGKFKSTNTEMVHIDGIAQLFCKDCYAKYRKALTDQDRYYMHKYGLTLQQVRTIFDRQHKRCGICGKKLRWIQFIAGQGRDIQWHLDHDHLTDEIRGILCPTCNKALGFFEKIIMPNFNKFTAYLHTALITIDDERR